MGLFQNSQQLSDRVTLLHCCARLTASQFASNSFRRSRNTHANKITLPLFTAFASGNCKSIYLRPSDTATGCNHAPLFGCSLHPRPNRTGCLLSRDPEASGNFPEKSWGCQNGCHPLNEWCSLHEILWAVAPKPVTPPGVAMRVAEFETQMERAPLAVCLCLLSHTHASQPLAWLLKKERLVFCSRT